MAYHDQAVHDWLTSLEPANGGTWPPGPHLDFFEEERRRGRVKILAVQRALIENPGRFLKPVWGSYVLNGALLGEGAEVTPEAATPAWLDPEEEEDYRASRQLAEEAAARQEEEPSEQTTTGDWGADWSAGAFPADGDY